MNIIYKDFSDLGEYFESVNKPQDFADFRPGSVMDKLQSWWNDPDKKTLPEMIPGGQEVAAVEVARTGATPVPGLVKKVSDAIGKEAADARLNNMVNARMDAWKAQDLKAFQDDPKSIAQPFTYKAPGNDPVTVNAARNANPQIYHSPEVSTPNITEMPGPLDPIPEDQLPGFLDKAKEVVNSITDLNGDGTTSGLEYGAIGAALAGAAGLGAKAFHNHHKNKKMKEAVQAYALRYPNSKLAKAAGFSEKDSNRVLKTMAGALGGGALGYLAGITLDDAGFYDAAGVAPLVGGALGASKVLAADAKRADSGELVNKKIQDLKSRLPEETYSKKLDKIAKKYTDEYGFTPEIGSIKDSLMKREELRALKKASKSERRNSPEYIKQKEERKDSAKELAKAAGKGMGIGTGIGAGVGAGFGTIFDAIYYGGRIYPEEVGAGALLGSVIGAAIGPGVGAIKHTINSRKVKSPDKNFSEIGSSLIPR